MTAPTLSPTEHAEVSRFGAHDEDILRDIAEHADDVIPCIIDGGTATHRLIMRCCGAAALMCTEHAAWHRRVWGREIRRRGVFCGDCKHDWPRRHYDDVVRVVIL